MQLMIAAAPPLRQMACGTQLPIANAAYRIENGVLCALPMPPALRGGAMLLTGAAVAFLVSLFAIRFLLSYIRKHDFKAFGWYRIVLGLLVLGYFFLLK